MMKQAKPFTFDEFFSSGFEESVSPFITESSRKLGKNVRLKSSILAAVLLFFTYVVSPFSSTASFLLLSFVYFLSGVPAIIHATKDIKNLEINIDVLMTVAALVALFIGNEKEGALLLVLFSLSASMEQMVTYKARGALHNLHQLSPKQALVIEEDGSYLQRSVKEIPLGAHLLVKAGEIIPLDGKVIQGDSSLNLIHLTGESLPQAKHVGDLVPAGAKNLEAALTIEVNRTSSDSTLSKIIDLITQAAKAKPRLQRWLDQFGKIYATTIILLTAAFALTLPLIFPIGYWGTEGGIYRALAFMIAASPCALIIATPTAYLSAISSCAKKGILLKGGVTLDAITMCKNIAFDKTGTLTTGKLYCSDVKPLINETYSIDFALSVAAALEKNVVHPISNAICSLAQEKKLQLPKIQNFQSLPGYGLEGKLSFEGKTLGCFIGLPDYVLSKLDEPSRKNLVEILKPIKEQSQILTLLLIGTAVFLFRFMDTLRPDMKDLVFSLKEKNKIHPIMMTGDHEIMAKTIGAEIGIDQIYFDLRPEDKLQIVSELSKVTGLAMVGDGINDAPALARATIGISMGKIGSFAAVDASDVVLLNDNLAHLGWLFSKAHKTLRIIKQNLSLALGVIVFATTPALLGFIPLWLAVVLHEGGTVIVGINSLRLLKK